MNNIITCTDLTLAYDGAIVVKDLSFSIPRGEIFLISGENGSGKSTLLKALLGLIRPVSGSVVFADGAQRGIGYLPQQSGVSRDFPATVREVVSSGFAGERKLGIFMPKGYTEKLHSAMHLTGTEKISHRCFNELSGGQQQRVLLSRALCASRDILILDEPTNGLDPESAAHMYSIITSLKREHNMTVIIVSHDLETSVTLADRVLHLCCDGAFCCDAADYAERLTDAHKENAGGVTHECNCGCPHEHDNKEEKQ